MEIWTVTAILLATLYLLISEKLPVDLTAIGIMVALMAGGILPPAEAVAGFANPAVVTVGAMFLISRAMIRTGSLGFVAQHIVANARGKARRALLLVLLIVGVASAFVNNTPVVVLFIPIILSLSCEYGLSPSKFLIPASYASILAGTCTLIGTSTNIIVRDLSMEYGYGDIGMFELSAVGFPIAVVGIAFLVLAAPRVMPGHAVPTCNLDERENRKYLAELTVSAEAGCAGRDALTAFEETRPSFEVFEIVRDGHILYPDITPVSLAAGDVLLVKGTADDLMAALRDDGLRLPHRDPELNYAESDPTSLIVELIIPPQSSLVGERLVETDLRNHPDVHVVAVKRRRLHYTEQKIRNLRFRVGDIILARVNRAKLERIRDREDFIIVEDVHHQIQNTRKAGTALSIFLALIVAAGAGLADIMVCALTAVFLLAITGCLHLRDAYRELRGDVLLIIVATIALGTAMQKTGTSEVYARAFLGLFQGGGPRVVLAAIVALTSLCTHLLSNNATAVLLLPIAVSTATGMGADPKPFIIGVIFGASACYATPIGYKTNLLVYGPGAYRFKDYLTLGLPLNAIVLVMASLLIPYVWPL
jgi:di/tricarboxylate transporter